MTTLKQQPIIRLLLLYNYEQISKSSCKKQVLNSMLWFRVQSLELLNTECFAERFGFQRAAAGLSPVVLTD